MSESSPTVLVTGAAGWIGSRTIEYLCDRDYHACGIVRNNVEEGSNSIDPAKSKTLTCNLSSPGEFQRIVTKFEPDVVVHAAACSSLGVCQNDPQKARMDNIQATQNIVQAISRMKPIPKLIYLSTDMVFDGRSHDYIEEDRPNPISVYGQSKWMAERIVEQIPNSVILRLGLVFGESDSNRPKNPGWMMERWKQNQPVDLFVDEIRTPVDRETIVQVIGQLIECDLYGLFHLGGINTLSRLEMGQMVAQKLNIPAMLLNSKSLKEQPDCSIRPQNLSLNSSKITQSISFQNTSFSNFLNSNRFQSELFG